MISCCTNVYFNTHFSCQHHTHKTQWDGTRTMAHKTPPGCLGHLPNNSSHSPCLTLKPPKVPTFLWCSPQCYLHTCPRVNILKKDLFSLTFCQLWVNSWFLSSSEFTGLGMVSDIIILRWGRKWSAFKVSRAVKRPNNFLTLANRFFTRW